jgi:hypothetical protein
MSEYDQQPFDDADLEHLAAADIFTAPKDVVAIRNCILSSRSVHPLS